MLGFAGRCWAATTTEGLLIYSLDTQMLFDPFELDTSVTPGQIRAALRQRDFTRAILMALRLNERKLVQEALESVPWAESERPPGLAGAGGGRVQKGAFLLVGVLCSVITDFPFSRSRRDQRLPPRVVRGESA